MGRNPDVLLGYLLLWVTIPASPLYASVEVHCTFSTKGEFYWLKTEHQEDT
jgi:hypothetical protein